MQVNGLMAGEAYKWWGGGGWGAYNRICLQVNGPIAWAAYKKGAGEGSYKRQFTVLG